MNHPDNPDIPMIGQQRAMTYATEQNRRLLRARLGREPSDVEMYYAHGLGGPAAAATLGDPSRPFGAGATSGSPRSIAVVAILVSP